MDNESFLDSEYDRVMSLECNSDDDKSGILLEDVTSLVLDKLGIPNEHNEFNSEYANFEAQGMDIKVSIVCLFPCLILETSTVFSRCEMFSYEILCA